MLRLICFSLVQSIFLAAGQVFLKLAMLKIGKFNLSYKYFRELMVNWHLLASGLSMLTASLLWFYIIKHYPLSIAYPLISFSYLFGALAAVFVFHETISFARWIGILFIMFGVALLAKP